MEFGRANNIDDVDFSLPPDHPDTEKVLRQHQKILPKIYAGCAKWGREDWVGTIYPEGMHKDDFLNHYAKNFKSVECNNTFYRLPSENAINSWVNAVGDDFTFCPKAWNKVSHIARLKEADELTKVMVNAYKKFGDRLGMIFLQLPPNFAPKSMPHLKNYLESFPKDIPLAIELRHKGWYEGEVYEDLYELLKANNITFVITDTSGRRDMLHMRLSTPVAFIRFEGNDLHASDFTRVDEWITRLERWLEMGLKEVYFFTHQHEEVNSPRLASYLIKQMNKRLGLNLTEPQLLS